MRLVVDSLDTCSIAIDTLRTFIPTFKSRKGSNNYTIIIS